MDRRTFVYGLALGTLSTPLAAEAQQTGRVWRVGYLGFTSPNPQTLRFTEALARSLRDLGYVEGQNLIIEYRWGEGMPARLAEAAADLVRVNVDIIYAPFTPAALAAKRATTRIPIVFSGGGDPVAVGLVASLARPGGNVTGLTLAAGVEIVGKSIQLLHEAVPTISKVALLWNPVNPAGRIGLKDAETAARSLGLQLRLVAADTPAAIETAFSTIATERADALVVFADVMFVSQRERLAAFISRSRLPAMFHLREHVEDGGLMAYGINSLAQVRRVAGIVDKILKGAKPADLPVEQPMKFELVINLKTAKALGLTIPQSVLMRADEIIQ